MSARATVTRGTALLLLVLAAGSAHAGPAPELDWARGMITAPGIGLADRQAPNPAVARGPSRRRAEDAAKRALAAAVAALPVATGGTVGTAAAEPAIKARVDHAIERAITVTAEPGTDGSWRVTMAVPTEALRVALTGPRTLPAAGDSGIAMLVVEGVTASPVLGYAINGTPAPVLWTSAVPAWAKSAPHAKATAVTAQGLTVDAPKASRDGGTLFVLIAPR